MHNSNNEYMNKNDDDVNSQVLEWKKRREERERERLRRLQPTTTTTTINQQQHDAHKHDSTHGEQQEQQQDEEDHFEESYQSLKKRKQDSIRQLLNEQQQLKKRRRLHDEQQDDEQERDDDNNENENNIDGNKSSVPPVQSYQPQLQSKVSLLEQVRQQPKLSEEQLNKMKEEEIVHAIIHQSHNPLMFHHHHHHSDDTTTSSSSTTTTTTKDGEYENENNDTRITTNPSSTATTTTTTATTTHNNNNQNTTTTTTTTNINYKNKTTSSMTLSNKQVFSWSAPPFVQSLSDEQSQMIRDYYHIDVQGRDIPPPITLFSHFRLPPVIQDVLSTRKNIVKPTAIQMQALPVILSGRDLIGIAFTGSGKSLVFILPMVLLSMIQEYHVSPLNMSGEGPLCLVLCPNRELARQTYDIILEFTSAINQQLQSQQQEQEQRSINVLLCTGGIPLLVNDQPYASHSSHSSESQSNHHHHQTNHHKGIHIVVATPGRLLHMLNDKRLTLDYCRMVCLDEADRLIDYTFEEDIRSIFMHLNQSSPSSSSSTTTTTTTTNSSTTANTNTTSNNSSSGSGSSTVTAQLQQQYQRVKKELQIKRQTLLFSATMPEKIQSFAKSSLIDPIVVNVGRAGAASLNVVQEVEFVKPESKMIYLLQVLQKTPPPVLIFCENKSDVDDIHEYLMLKGVSVVSIHAGKSQTERQDAILSFKSAKSDVLVATDIVSKGLDFPHIQHVINYDMPKQIEDYVHRIGRTGRGDRTGLATTFINFKDSEGVLMDLKHLLKEAKQRVPKILESIKSDMTDSMMMGMGQQQEFEEGAGAAAGSDSKPCEYCGGLGHRITNCRKLERDRADRVRKAQGVGMSSAGGGGGDY